MPVAVVANRKVGNDFNIVLVVRFIVCCIILPHCQPFLLVLILNVE